MDTTEYMKNDEEWKKSLREKFVISMAGGERAKQHLYANIGYVYRCYSRGAIMAGITMRRLQEAGMFYPLNTQKWAAPLRKPPNIISISQIKYKCLFSFYPIFASFSYETSHLENRSSKVYYEDTKKE